MERAPLRFRPTRAARGYRLRSGRLRQPDDSAAEPRLQIYCMGFLPPGVSDKPGVMLCPTLIRPESFGWLRLNSADPVEKPLISPNYFSHPQRPRPDGSRRALL